MELDQISRILFQDKKTYKNINPDEKARLFFMFNRLMIRGIVNIADALNRKDIDTSLAMDIWFNYAKSTTKTPDWFKPNWSKLKKPKEESVLKGYDAMDKWILSHYPDAIEEERKRLESEKEDVIEVTKKRGAKKKKK